MGIYSGLDNKDILNKERDPRLDKSAGTFLVSVNQVRTDKPKGLPELFELKTTILEATNPEDASLKPGTDASYTIWEDQFDKHVLPMARIAAAILDEPVKTLSASLVQQLETEPQVKGTQIRITNTRVFKTDKAGKPVMSKKYPDQQVNYIESKFEFVSAPAAAPVTEEAPKGKSARK